MKFTLAEVMDASRMKAWRRAAVAAAMLVATTASPAAAWTDDHRDQIDWCADGGYPPNMQIRGCTVAIQSGTFSGKGLAFIYVNRGNAYYNNRDYDRAIADYDQAIRLDPSDVESYDRRAKADRAKRQTSSE